MKNFVDYYRLRNRRKRIYRQAQKPEYYFVQVRHGGIRVRDTGGNGPVLAIVPDGPNIIEHYDALIARLRDSFRVVCFDLPGFGFSYPALGYDYSFSQTTGLIRELFDQLNVERATLSFPCANGFYALAFAHAHPGRVSRLMMVQTPAMSEMERWTKRVVPFPLKVPMVGQIAMALSEKYFAGKWYDYALPKGKDRAPYRDIALAGLQGGGCFCLASLTQGLLREKANSRLLHSQVPALLCYGDKDLTHRHTDFSTLRTYNPVIRQICFEGCGHFPDLEDPGRFAKILEENLLPV